MLVRRIPAGVHLRARIVAAKADISVEELIRRALVEYLSPPEKEGAGK